MTASCCQFWSTALLCGARQLIHTWSCWTERWYVLHSIREVHLNVTFCIAVLLLGFAWFIRSGAIHCILCMRSYRSSLFLFVLHVLLLLPIHMHLRCPDAWLCSTVDLSFHGLWRVYSIGDTFAAHSTSNYFWGKIPEF